MKKILFGLLLLFSTSLYSQSDVIQDSFILVIDYDTVNVVDDSTFLVFISAKADQFGNGYIATGIDSGYIFIDGRGESYYVDSIGARSATDGWFRIIENETISGSPSGRGWVFKPLSSGLIPVPPSNANGVAPILVAKVIANNAIKARTYYVDSSTTTVNTITVGSSDIDTLLAIDGMNQARIDSMGVIGITRTRSGWVASTAARDTLYPDGFVFSMYGTDSMIVTYGGTIEFSDSVFVPGRNYYQPYEYTKYQTSADTILEQLVFKAIDTNKIEIRDRYSYLASGASQSSRSIPDFFIDISDYTDNTVAFALLPDSNYMTRTGSEIIGYTDPYNSVAIADGNNPVYENDSSFIEMTSDYFTVSSSGFDTVFSFVAVVEFDAAGSSSDVYLIGNRGNNPSGVLKRSTEQWRFWGGASYVVNLSNLPNVTYGTKYLMVCNINPSGSKFKLFNPDTGAQLGTTQTSASYIEAESWNDLTIGARNFTNDPFIGKIYGFYFLEGNLDDAEMTTLGQNWNEYHKY